MRKIGIIHGSDSDLPQMYEGLLFLRACVKEGSAQILSVDSASQHRHTLLVQEILELYHQWSEANRPQVLIVCAGWANHLTGCVDAYLRYKLRNDKIVVFGVAFEDENPENTQAAILSILRVPGTQVVYKGVGTEGFLKACQDAVNEKLPEIKLKESPAHHRRNLQEAIGEAFTRSRAQLVAISGVKKSVIDQSTFDQSKLIKTT